jgi:hypothetical protein
MQKLTLITLIATVLFYVLNTTMVYNLTQPLLGKVVGQDNSGYAHGNGLHNRGFLLHSVVFAVVLYFILKRQGI